ncbi:zona pellucida sperm-binding protein 3 receptor-like isoform X2 [Choloepus didactylus]|uniref:zona pellucida sperm-binding protein 3 receptor-like isoform X2 n=1 Tax=Choloepus didactylus TaxID=27675 RepID=UPI00189D80D3|nr:zona pellucida sperm-binding protein 3 receptor-like isoform X2 [Choloepus didactylus]
MALCLKPKIPNGRLSVEKDQYVNSETVTVQCNPGYTLVGSQKIFCSEKKSWSPDVPTCEREVPEYHGIILSGRNLLRCLPNSQDTKLALELNKVSVEIENLEQERDKEKKTI